MNDKENKITGSVCNEEMYEPSFSGRLCVVGVVFVLYILASLYFLGVEGLRSPFAIAVFLFIGFFKVCGVFIKNAAWVFPIALLLAIGIGAGNLILFFRARSALTWLVSCFVFLSLILISLGGCSMIGKIVDG